MKKMALKGEQHTWTKAIGAHTSSRHRLNRMGLKKTFKGNPAKLAQQRISIETSCTSREGNARRVLNFAYGAKKSPTGQAKFPTVAAQPIPVSDYRHKGVATPAPALVS